MAKQIITLYHAVQKLITKDQHALGMFEARHKAISDLLYRNAWQTLQNIDSKIANDVMDSLTRESIPVIPVHDSFIVPESKAQLLQQAMHEQYEINTGMEASIA